jgi:hypothetical protein
MTKKKIARSKQRGKRRKERPVDQEIRRTAERAGIAPKPEAPEAAELPPEWEGVLSQLTRDGLRPSRGRALLGALRGVSPDEVRRQLRGEASMLELLAERLTPSQEAQGDMLRDALEVISAARNIFYVDGEDNDAPDALLREALRTAEQEFDLFSVMKESRGSDLHWQELWRASYRTKLAWKLAEFGAKHPEWKPGKTEQVLEQAEPAAGGAS